MRATWTRAGAALLELLFGVLSVRFPSTRSNLALPALTTAVVLDADERDAAAAKSGAGESNLELGGQCFGNAVANAGAPQSILSASLCSTGTTTRRAPEDSTTRLRKLAWTACTLPAEPLSSSVSWSASSSALMRRLPTWIPEFERVRALGEHAALEQAGPRTQGTLEALEHSLALG